MLEVGLLFLVVVLFSGLFLFKEIKILSIKGILSFSGAFLLSTIIFELLPEAYGDLGAKAGFYIIGGLIFQNFLEFYSKGAEHGHFHHRQDQLAKNNLWVIYLSLCIHAVLEGLPVSGSEQFLWAITLHKVPISILLAFFLKTAQISKKRSFLLIILFATMTPLGSFLLLVLPSLNNYHAEILAFISGLLLHIATIILFESKDSGKHEFDKMKLFNLIVSAILVYVMH